MAEEARVLKIAISALEATGLSGLKISLGDLGLFNALLDDMDMPERWRRRLRHQFWRSNAFHQLLQHFAKPSLTQRTSISANVDAMARTEPVAAVSAIMAAANLPVVTDRSLEDIAERLSEKLADRSQKPLDAGMVKTIEAYLTLEGPATEMPALLHAIAGGAHFKAAVAVFERRIAALEDLGLNPRRFHFSANFGRELEYYTGFVFQIDKDAHNAPLTVAGGGRYDKLLQDLGASMPIAAVGCAIHTERVKAVMA